MKKFTFITSFGVFSSTNTTLRAAYAEVCKKDSRICMAAVIGGTVSICTPLEQAA